MRRTLFRVVQESLSNVARHANAEHVVVETARDHGRAVVRIADDGDGFALRDAREDGIGLVGMRVDAARSRAKSAMRCRIVPM